MASAISFLNEVHKGKIDGEWYSYPLAVYKVQRTDSAKKCQKRPMTAFQKRYLTALPTKSSRNVTPLAVL